MVAGKQGDTATFLYLWGHPFEHQLFDAPMPQDVAVLTPAGLKIGLTRTPKKVTMETAEAKAAAYRFDFMPNQRGDFVFLLSVPPQWMEEEQEFFHDSVKVILHVQAQKGWDQAAGQAFELLPLTRPYGLQAGMVFQAQALVEGKPLPGSLVEIEHYNATAPKQLPPDEHITRTVKTDPNGVATVTLPEAGWWAITAVRDGGTRVRDGKNYPVKTRSTLWVPVDDKVTVRCYRVETNCSFDDFVGHHG